MSIDYEIQFDGPDKPGPGTIVAATCVDAGPWKVVAIGLVDGELIAREIDPNTIRLRQKPSLERQSGPERHG